MIKAKEIIIRPQTKQIEALEALSNFPVLFYGGAKGGGKAQPLDELVSTPYGWRTMGNIQVGNRVHGANGRPTRVIAIHPQGQKEIYKVSFIDGSSCRVTAEHLWKAKFVGHSTGWKIYPTHELINRVNNVLIPLTEPVVYTKPRGRQKWEIEHHYAIGAMIGDGCLTRTTELTYTTADPETLRYFEVEYKKRKARYVYSFSTKTILYAELKHLGLLETNSHTKFLPEYLLYEPVNDRKRLLAGLMDTDGTIDKDGRMSYSTVSRVLADGVQMLVRGLGGKATISKKKDSYNIYIVTKFNPFAMKRKRARFKPYNGGLGEANLRIKSIEFVGKAECQCITVSNLDGLYLTKDFIVTHNSWLIRAWQVARRVKYSNTRGVIIRKTYPELLANHIQMMWKEFPDLRQYYKKTEKSIHLPNGSILDFRHLKSTDDVYNYQGVQYEDIALDECTQHAEMVFTMLRSSNRTTDPNIKCRFLLTGNPGGVGHGWVKRLFIDKNLRPNENPDDYGFVQAFVQDNDVLIENDPDYVNRLRALPEDKMKAYLLGDWEIFEGQFFSEFRKDHHVIAPRYSLADLPQSFRYWLTWDEGTLAPRAVHLLARDNDGRVEAIWEYYYAGEVASVAARKIKEELTRLGCYKFLQKVVTMIYDPAMNIKGNEGRSTIEIVANILELDNYPVAGNNDRIVGAARFKEYMAWDELNEPLIRFWNTCTEVIRTLPELIYVANGKEDIDSDGEDHCYDGIRYGLMSMGDLPPRFADIRKQQQLQVTIVNHINDDPYG